MALPLSKFSSALLKSAIATAFVGAGLSAVAPARASVLVEPRIMTGDLSESTANAATEASAGIVEIATSTDEFSTLATAVQAADLVSILSGEGPFTVFAPTNAAFASLPAGALDALLMPENRDLLVKVLYNHVGYGDVTSDELSDGAFETFDGTVAIDVEPTGVMVDSANVIQADVAATNGVIHAVDQVLLPVGFTEQLQARIESSASTASSTSSSTTITETTTLEQQSSPTPAPMESTPAAAPVEAPASEPAAQEPVRGLW